MLGSTTTPGSCSTIGVTCCRRRHASCLHSKPVPIDIYARINKSSNPRHRGARRVHTRLFDPGSDRAAEKWRHDLVIPGVPELDLHHLYRTMGWLGEELADQSGRGLAPRTTKDLIEERLFALRNDLFSEVSLVFLDTTSLYFEGRGSLGQYGHSKD